MLIQNISEAMNNVYGAVNYAATHPKETIAVGLLTFLGLTGCKGDVKPIPTQEPTNPYKHLLIVDIGINPFGDLTALEYNRCKGIGLPKDAELVQNEIPRETSFKYNGSGWVNSERDEGRGPITNLEYQVVASGLGSGQNRHVIQVDLLDANSGYSAIVPTVFLEQNPNIGPEISTIVERVAKACEADKRGYTISDKVLQEQINAARVRISKFMDPQDTRANLNVGKKRKRF